MNQSYSNKYVGVSLKKDLIEAIELQRSKDPSYTSITEFIRTAIREKLERMEGGA